MFPVSIVGGVQIDQGPKLLNLSEDNLPSPTHFPLRVSSPTLLPFSTATTTGMNEKLLVKDF